MPIPAALPRRRERQVESTRARVFQAALEEFGRVGFAKASVTRIARGIPSGSSIEFASKDILADAIEGRKPL